MAEPIFTGIAGAVRAKDGETCWKRSTLVSLLGRWKAEAPFWQRPVYDAVINQVWKLPVYPVGGKADETEASQTPIGRWE